jgi:tRNA (guanosine-2'-O-)-methyltransferase
MYNTPSLNEERRQRTLFEGGHPIFAEACQRKGLPYPKIDADGQIVADTDWWQKNANEPKRVATY